MKTAFTSIELRGRAIGSLFFAGFGVLWISLALAAKQMLTTANLTFVALDFCVLLGMAIWLIREARHFPAPPSNPLEGKRVGRNFGLINAAQWIAGAIVAVTLVRMHLDAYVPCAITAIVGLHLFPLARLFRYAMHYVTGTVLLMWAALTATLVPPEHLQGTTALGTGIILWISAFTTLCLAFTIARRRTRTASVAEPA